MQPVVTYLPLHTRKPRRIHPRQILIGFLIGVSGVAGFVIAAKLLSK